MANREPTAPTEFEDRGLLSATIIAKVLMVNVSRVHQMGREGILPREAGGKYRLVPAIQGYIKFLKKDYEDEDLISLSKEKARLTKAHRERAELELASMRREYIPADEVEFELANVIKTLLTGLEPLPDQLERKAKLSAEQVDRVEQTIREIRAVLYEKLTSLPEYQTEEAETA